MINKNYSIIVILIIHILFINNSVFASNRIISLIPSSTELLFAIGFGDEVIAVSNYCNYPEEKIRDLPKIGDQNLILEKILSLKPSILVDTNGIHKKYSEKLKKLKLNYINIDIKSQLDIPNAALILGKELGDLDKANKFIEKWNREIKSLQQIDNNKTPKAYMEIWNNPIQAVGGNNNMNDMLQLAGGKNILEEQKDYPIVNTEMIILNNPDIIFLVYPNADIESVRNRPGWKNIKAIKNNNIFTLNQDILVRPGPRNLEAIKIINSIISKVTNNESVK